MSEAGTIVTTRGVTGPVDLHCWVLLGQQGSRKGSTIRALTGVYRSKDIEVMLVNEQSLRLWCQVQSINEPEKEENPSPDEWVKSCIFHSPHYPMPSLIQGRHNILIALRLDRGRAGREPEDYLNALCRAGATIESIVTLGESTRAWTPLYGAPYAHIIDTKSVPTNSVAAQVRQFWGWR